MNNELLKKHDFHFSKKYGQNFIFDQNLLSAICNDAGITKDTTVVEIGAGAGTLTKIMASKSKQVISYEIDETLRPVLMDNLSDCDNVKLIFGDIMKVSMEDIERDIDEYLLVANLPYYITTPIIFKFLENATKLKSLTIMVQKEVADRIVATENTKDYGSISASIAYRGDASIKRIVKRTNFTPIPNVDSAIVRIDFRKNKYDIDNTDTLDRLIKSAFAMRRKTLINNLKSSFNLSANTISNVFDALGIDKNIRGEAVDIGTLVKLSNELIKYLK